MPVYENSEVQSQSCSQYSATDNAKSSFKVYSKFIVHHLKFWMHLQTLHVRRIFDEGHKSLLYIAYSTRFMQDDKVIFCLSVNLSIPCRPQSCAA